MRYFLDGFMLVWVFLDPSEISVFLKINNIADIFFYDTKSLIFVPNRATRLENARIDLKIGILTKLTGPHRLVTSPIPLKHSVMVIDIVKKKTKNLQIK